ncbi:conjugal transfer protein [Pandoraea cepalis]|uniref:Conjugal transfer protein n=1 Tax=Pandoraea cepalis TaxID=2508294 RepID=A0AAW7MGJ1_9BURK|nr:MobF family relaxase [Pandoraea cepalis]MDN4571889.1 conjugal transfer protein [Pandoraea cepalis]MDN4581343.1 conjugal transfer protein [Pandoraea cepalis]
MISRTHISGGGVANSARYFDKSFSQDGIQRADNYYVNEVASAHWQGRGAEILGIQGEEVKRRDFVEFLAGQLVNPDTGEIQNLADNSKGDNRRAGMDFTISPPKSVSIAGLIGNDPRIVEAHLQANATAMRWLEKHASVIRVKDENGRNKSVRANNLLYATVLHETNRENEPQIHSHNVIVSAVYDENAKKWRSLTNDDMLKLRARADDIYKGELAHGLKEAGYELAFDKNGVDFQIAGFSQEQLDRFSTRKAQMRAVLKERNIDPEGASFEARQAAALSSRAAKKELPRAELQSLWQEAAQSVGLEVEKVVGAARVLSGEPSPVREADRSINPTDAPGRERAGGDPREGEAHGRADPAIARTPETTGRSEERRQRDGSASLGRKGGRPRRSLKALASDASEGQRSALAAVSWAIEHLTEREQTFTLVDLELNALRFSRGSFGDVEWAIQQHVTNHLILERKTDAAELTYTTHRGIEAEMRLAERIRAGVGQNHVVIHREEDFDTALAAFEARKSEEVGQPFKLSAEQVASARNVLMHSDTYQGIQGDAGAGKTAALEMVRESATSAGWNIIGIATSAAAAKELGIASGIESDTVGGFFAKRDSQIMATQLRLNELRTAIRDGKPIRLTGEESIESRRLKVSTADVNFGTGRYTFDHQRGEVFRSPDNFRNAVGALLTDIANRHRSSAMEARADARTLGEHVRAGALALSTRVADTVGRRLSQIEQVGTVEAVAARVSLYMANAGEDDGTAREFKVKEAELSNLRRFGNIEGKPTLIVMDESSLTGVHDTEKISELAATIGARVVFQGDVKQHGSVAAGRAFKQAQESGMNVSVLEETRRFDKATSQTKSALQEMKAGNYAAAIGRLDTLEVTAMEFAGAVADRYLDNVRQLEARGLANPKVGVVAITNRDRKAINEAIHDRLVSDGRLKGVSFGKVHLDDAKLTKAEQSYAVNLSRKGVNALVFRKAYREIGVQSGDVVSVLNYDVQANRIKAKTESGKIIEINPQRQDFFSPARWETRSYAVGDEVETRGIIRLPEQETKRIANGTRGVITEIDFNGARVKWTRDGTESKLTNNDIRLLDFAYAHTSYKEQGATNDREIIAVSGAGAMVFNKEAAYVAATRAKDNTEIVTSDLARLMQNAGRSVDKTTAVEMKEVIRAEQSKVNQQAASMSRQKEPTLEKVKDKGRMLEI